MLAVSLDPNITLGAILLFIPAMLNVWLNTRTQRKLKTNHGKTIGEHVEKVTADLDLLSTKFDVRGVTLMRHDTKLDELYVALEHNADILAAHAAVDEENFRSLQASLVRQETGRDEIKADLLEERERVASALGADAATVRGDLVADAEVIHDDLIEAGNDNTGYDPRPTTEGS